MDIARLSADSYLRRMWGEHGLTGRRLYLSVWNLVEAWDATNDLKYLEDLRDRVNRMLALKTALTSHGLYKYYHLTKEERVRQAFGTPPHGLRGIWLDPYIQCALVDSLAGEGNKVNVQLGADYFFPHCYLMTIP